ncbi:hypothetical protein MASR1M12_00940 [Erysipelotrichia bacterium]
MASNDHRRSLNHRRRQSIPAKALISDANGKVWSSGVTATELGWLVGVTSGIQAQFSGKAAKVHAHGNITDFGAIGSTAGLLIINNDRESLYHWIFHHRWNILPGHDCA